MLAALVAVKDMGQRHRAHLAHDLRLRWPGAFDEKGKIALMAKHAVGTVSIRGNTALLVQGQPEHTAAERIGEER